MMTEDPPDWLDQDWQHEIVRASDSVAGANPHLDSRDALLVLVVEQLHYIADELDALGREIRLSRLAANGRAK